METQISFLEAIEGITFTVVSTLKDKSLAREIYLEYMNTTRKYNQAIKILVNGQVAIPSYEEYISVIDRMFEEMWEEVHND